MKMEAIKEPVDTPSGNLAREARRTAMNRITHFVMRHDLDITGPNLAVIGSALTGSDAELAKEFAAREMSGEPIDQKWIDMFARKATGGRKDRADSRRMKALEELMDRMEQSLASFSDVAQSAKDESCEQRIEIDAKIEEMSRCELEGYLREELDRVLEISQTMVERMSQVEVAMERSKAETTMLRDSLAKARVEADIDHLTRLPNRRSFERRLAEAARKIDAVGGSMCVAFCDVDHFKAVNDTHGHDAGDRVLVSVAAMLNRFASKDCFVARHGGEEFVLIFEGSDKQAAWRKLDSIRRAQAEKRLINRETGKAFGRITFSAGIAEVGGVDDARAALARADEALYRAKEEGRNRVVAV